MKDPQNAILVYLMRTRSASDRTAAKIAEATGHSVTTVNDHLKVMGTTKGYGGPWVTKQGRPAVWTLTEYGRGVARHRARS